jgi:hypothetical protein
MAHSINDFKSALSGGGARPNLFQVDLTLPTTIDPDEKYEDGKFSILCKSAALPASNIASIDVPFRGRIFKVAGDRTFDTWTITVINDQDFAIRTTMESWMQSIGQYADASGFTNPASYMVDATVKQFKRGDKGSTLSTSSNPNATGSGLDIAKVYKFYSIFPTSISAIDLSYDSSDTIEEFTVDFQVQYWAPEPVRNQS